MRRVCGEAALRFELRAQSDHVPVERVHKRPQFRLHRLRRERPEVVRLPFGDLSAETKRRSEAAAQDEPRQRRGDQHERRLLLGVTDP